VNDELIVRSETAAMREQSKKDRIKELRAELDALGYHVIKKDWVRKFGVQQMVNLREMHLAMDGGKVLLERIYRDMGMNLGVGILESGAMQRTVEDDIELGRVYRATVDVILRDPQFDKPEWLR
jgi:hypothetical protein